MIQAATRRPVLQVALDSSPLAEVSDAAWDRFLRALSVQTTHAVSASGGYGSFDLRPRRLCELGVMRNLRTHRRDGRQVWIGDFVAPYNTTKMRDLRTQRDLLARSMRLYDQALGEGVYGDKLPEGVTRSGALAILHRGGRGALKSWPSGAFEETKVLFARANGIF